jgi:hypothetical protein
VVGVGEPRGADLLDLLPPDPMVKMMSLSTGIVKPFVEFARTLFTRSNCPPVHGNW